MARLDINRLEETKGKNHRIHELVAGEYSIITSGTDKLLQIDTFGREGRQIAGKVSQSIQFDKNILEKLVQIYQSKFI